MFKTINTLLLLFLCLNWAQASPEETTEQASREVLQASLGKILWTYEALNELRPTLFTSKKLLIGAIKDEEEIVAVNRRSGKMAWISHPPKKFLWSRSTVAISPDEQLLALILDDGGIWTIELRKGRTAWTYKAKGGSKSLFSVQRLFSLTSLGSLHVLDWKSGRAKWRYRPLPDDIVITAVTPYRERLYLANRGGRARALSRQNGLQRWQSEKIEGLSPEEPTITPSRILLRTKSDELYALHHYTGETAWHYRYDSPLTIAPTLSENRVTLCRKNGLITALGLGLGKVLWEQDLATSIGHTEVSDRYVLLQAPLKEELIVLSARKGNILWRKKVKLNDGKLESVIAKSLIICGSSADITWQREIVAYHGRTGQTVWRLRLPQSLTSKMYIDQRTVFCAIGDTMLAATFNAPSWSTVMEVNH